MELLSFHLRRERVIIAELSSGRNARSRGPWIKKFGFLYIRTFMLADVKCHTYSLEKRLSDDQCHMTIVGSGKQLIEVT